MNSDLLAVRLSMLPHDEDRSFLELEARVSGARSACGSMYYYLLWGITFVGETRTVDTHIQTLRKKINDACPGAGDAIETVCGVGYRLSRES